ncbi:MAG: hypothetical protein GYA23_01130 [Methanomicrobiales archaeon]|nr:hypothetical protein [Methanomicrobiales archaeon]
MKEQSFRLRLRAILAVLFLVSVTIAPAMAAGAINQEMTCHRSTATAPLSISHGTFHHLHPGVILGLKWWHWAVIVAGAMAIGWYIGCSPLAGWQWVPSLPF